jgi:ABC-2 family transporter protein
MGSGIRVGKPRQASALIKKAISYQSRQLFTNISVGALCPFILVFLAGFGGSLIIKAIQSSTPIKEYVYCSNQPAMNEINIPYWNLKDQRLPKSSAQEFKGATLDEVIHANFAYVTGLLGLSGPPGALAASYTRPCVRWFGENYPKSALYERDPGESGSAVRDASYLAQPLGGWLNALNQGNGTLVDAFSVNLFQGSQLKAAAIVGYDNELYRNLIGSKPKQNPLPPIIIGQTSSPLDFPPTSNSTGLLEAIPTRLFSCLGFNAVAGGPSLLALQPTPWYNVSKATSDELDDTISAQLQNVIIGLAKIPKDKILSNSPEDFNKVFLEVAAILENLPHGAVYFRTIDHSEKKYSVDFHIGTDVRIKAASNFPPPGPRILFQQTQLSNAILKQSNSRFSSAQITQGFRILPQVTSSKFFLPFGSLIGGILYPFGVSFLLPIFVIILVQEKEARILVMMTINGMRPGAYYLSHYITFLLLFTLSSAVFLTTGFLTGLTLFTQTEISALLLLFFVWGNNQVALSFFFATLFDRSRIALISVFLMVLCSVIVNNAIDQLYMTGRAPSLMFLWPFFGFFRALSLANQASFDPSKFPIKLSDLFGTGEIAVAFFFQILTIFLYLGIAGYLNAVFPSEFGIQRPWYFPVTWFYSLFGKFDGETFQRAEIEDVEIQFEDDDVRAERERVLASDFNPQEYPLVIKNMRKAFAGFGGQNPKLAVKDVTFAVEKGIVFGLLGPNVM